MRHSRTIGHMTTQRSERIPELTLGWRLKMALGDMKRDEMADILGVNPATVSRWMGDKGQPPKRAYLAQWAFATGVSLEWLEKGVSAAPTPTPPGESGDALARLTASKRSKRRGGAAGVATEGYLLSA